MRSVRAQWLVVLAGVGAALVLWPGAARLWLTAGSVLALAVAAGEAFGRARRLRDARPSPFGALTPAAPAPERPRDLARFERMLGWKAYSPEDFRHRVAPVLTRILTARLQARGIDPERDPAAARAAAGPAAALLDPPPDDGPPIDTAGIARLVDAIEAL